MSNTLGMAAHAAGLVVRVGWYVGLNRIVGQEARRLADADAASPDRRPEATVRGPMPSTRDLLTDLGRLLLDDAAAVRDGLYPPMDDEAQGLVEQLRRVREMLGDLPAATGRRLRRDASGARLQPEAEGLPDYFVQDFHFQTGGYLTDESARLYDLQVETLFTGSAGPMRRQALKAIAGFMQGRDQRKIALLDVACGTGRFLRQVRLTYPAMQLKGLDLSRAYLEEARRHMGRLRPAMLLPANAEAIPLPDQSQDIVTTIFLFHELPPEVRRRVIAEMARVLKPGGLLVFIDSLQKGDRPEWNGILEQFPERFHEPYYRHYLIDDLAGAFKGAGLDHQAGWTAYLSKVMVWRKGEASSPTQPRQG